MATVSIQDDDIHRWVIRHQAPSIAGGDPRHRVVAVLDNQQECIDTLKRLLEDLDQRRARGEDIDPGEDFTGLLLEPGDLTREPLALRALQRGSWHLPRPDIVISGERHQE